MAELSITQRKLRMLCERVPRVFGRHRGAHPAIEPLGAALLPKANAFVEAYDKVINHEIARKAAMAAGHAAADELYARMRIWQTLVEIRVGRASWKPSTGSAACPDQLMGDAQRLMALVQQHRDGISCAQECLENVREALANTEQLWMAAQVAQVKHQRLQKRARELGVEANTEIIVFRKLLRAVLGQSHHDYQSLRYRRSKQAEAVGEEMPIADNIEAAAPEVTSAASSRHEETFPLGSSVVDIKRTLLQRRLDEKRGGGATEDRELPAPPSPNMLSVCRRATRSRRCRHQYIAARHLRAQAGDQGLIRYIC